jgi:hypothetical protein
MFWNPSLPCLSMYLFLKTLLFVFCYFLGHISISVLSFLSLFYSPSPAVISDSSLHWHFLCFFWIPWTSLHLLVLYLLSLSNTRSGFFCVLFPPLVLIYHLFRYITFKFSVRTPHPIFQQLPVISLTFTHLLYLLLTSWRSTFAVLSLMGRVLADWIQ